MSQSVVSRAFTPGASVSEDTRRRVLEAAERHDFDAKLTKTVAEVFDRAIEAGHGDEDMAATLYAYER